MVNGTDPRIVGAGVEIDVIGLGGGMSVLKSTVTNAAGRFRIEGLPTGSRMMIRASYHSVNYHSPIKLDASGKARVEVEIFELTTSMKGIHVDRVRLGFQLDGEHLRALETYSFVNETEPKRTFMSPEGNFRFTKPERISDPPRLSVQGPDSFLFTAQVPAEARQELDQGRIHPELAAQFDKMVMQLSPDARVTRTPEGWSIKDQGRAFNLYHPVHADTTDVFETTMPLTQSPLESADGKSYYSLYALRPGTTVFEVDYLLPYHDGKYTFQKKFFNDIDFFQIGVIPQDLDVEGQGLKRAQVDAKKNFAVYTGGPVKAGSESLWTFSGGTPVAASESSGEARIRPMPNSVSRYAFVIGPLVLMAFIVALWYAYNSIPEKQPKGQDPRTRALKARRDRLLEIMATLDDRFESKELDQREYQRLRSQAKSQLRRVAMLLGKK